MQALWHPSPNYGPRKGGAEPKLIVLHYTAMDSAKAALQRLCDPQAEVSAHYLIGADGTLWQLVKDDQRAWHAGAGAWGSITDVNSHSLGIELDNTGAVPFAKPQMRRLKELLRKLMARHDIPAHRIIGHSDMAPSRKSDPGALFDWHDLAHEGLSVWPLPTLDPPTDSFATLAHRFGYPADEDADTLLTAFRLRFRPDHTGPQDGTDLAMIHDLARRFPVDADQHRG